MGLIYTLQIGSPSSHWIGYQVIAGLGVGFAFQVPQIVAQSICEITEVSHYIAISLCKPSLSHSQLTLGTDDRASLPNDGRDVLHLCGRVNLFE
jgi:hypothetical protein